MYKSHRYNTGGFLFSLTYKHKKKSDKPVQLFRASCRIRTNDPEITNHVLWPTELKRRFSAAVIVKISNLLENGCKDTHYFLTAKTFRDFF